MTALTLPTPELFQAEIEKCQSLTDKPFAVNLALGADGINMGTRFMVTQEAPIHEGIKQKIVEMDENQTRLIFRTYKNTARVYRNGIADEVVEIEASGGEFGQVHHLVSGQNQEKAW